MGKFAGRPGLGKTVRGPRRQNFPPICPNLCRLPNLFCPVQGKYFLCTKKYFTRTQHNFFNNKELRNINLNRYPQIILKRQNILVIPPRRKCAKLFFQIKMVRYITPYLFQLIPGVPATSRDTLRSSIFSL